MAIAFANAPAALDLMAVWNQVRTLPLLSAGLAMPSQLVTNADEQMCCHWLIPSCYRSFRAKLFLISSRPGGVKGGTEDILDGDQH